MAGASVLALFRHTQRGGRSRTEMVTVVMRSFLTSRSHSKASWPPGPFDPQLVGTDLGAQDRLALLDGVEFCGVEHKRGRRLWRYGNGLYLEIALALVPVAAGERRPGESRRKDRAEAGAHLRPPAA
ncbi:MAG: hypothetical protein ACXW3X_13880 [Rhodoplanes sp.]